MACLMTGVLLAVLGVLLEDTSAVEQLMRCKETASNVAKKNGIGRESTVGSGEWTGVLQRGKGGINVGFVRLLLGFS